MGHRSEVATPDNSDDESGGAFTDGDFGDSDDETILEHNESKSSNIPVNETVNEAIDETLTNGNCSREGDEASPEDQPQVNGRKNSDTQNDVENYSAASEVRRDSHGDQNPSIVGILGDQHNHAEQRLAARRAARAEAREIRMRELERQQREQEDHADKAYDMYAETVGRRGGARLAALSPAASLVHSPRRSSEDSADDTFNVKDLRHELKEVEEKFRKAMILNAQLDNDKAALHYQLELLKDRILDLQEEFAQLQALTPTESGSCLDPQALLPREHREKCSAHERLRREHAGTERELGRARDAVRARDAAAAHAGFAFAEAAPGATHAEGFGAVPPLALLSHDQEKALADQGEGTLDVRLQKLVTAKTALESEVRKLKLTLNEERAARQNGVSNQHDADYENELEGLRKSVSEAKGRAARAEAEAALQAAGVARLEAQLQRLRARQDATDEREEQLKQERRKLQREAREALNRVEELETENSHLTKRLDKLKNAKSALLKDL